MDDTDMLSPANLPMSDSVPSQSSSEVVLVVSRDVSDAMESYSQAGESSSAYTINVPTGMRYKEDIPPVH